MSRSDPRWLNNLVSQCFGLLIGALAVFAAVRLIEAVWVALLLILGVGAVLVVVAYVLRARGRRGW